MREGEALRRIGISAELFDDHSPLQLGVSGTRQGLAFSLLGRLQYGFEGGTWNEWHAVFDGGRSAWLSEDNGAYVLAFDAPLPRDAPPDAQALAALRAGQRVVVDGRGWDVASVVRAKLIAAQGELPQAPRLEGEFTVVDLRNELGEVGTLDASDAAQLHWSVGRGVALSELRLSGLKDTEAEKSLSGKGVACPSCGSALEIKLSSTKSIACQQCHAVVDVSQGIGAGLAHYQQNNSGVGGQEPQIALGKTGTLALGGAPLPWQVVGYQERCDIPAGSDEETSFWREYLLYHRSAGFAFLVDSNDGWSWVKPITGAPKVRGDAAEWQGTVYRKRWTYSAKVTWVLGEFYWRVQRDEKALVSDYEGTGNSTDRRLSREQTGNEVTWSAGQTIEAATVADAFAIAPGARAGLQRDVGVLSSTSSSKGLAIGKGLVIFLVVVVLMIVLANCSGDDCKDVQQTFGAASAEYQQCQRSRGSGSGVRTGGGSYGGWSSGGGGSHK